MERQAASHYQAGSKVNANHLEHIPFCILLTKVAYIELRAVAILHANVA